MAARVDRDQESVASNLQDLAAAGFIGISYDPWQHGERGTETREQLAGRVFSKFRAHMWPIIGQTALDTLRVIDWAIANLGAAPVIYMGGNSMGGDIAVAAAGLDPRIVCVAAIVATPDWTRPGMRRGTKDSPLIPTGEADAYAAFFYDHINPLTHLSHYARRPAITFECGAEDAHVPPDGALRFEAALRQQDPLYAERLRVNMHPGIAHEVTTAMWEQSLAWLKQW